MSKLLINNQGVNMKKFFVTFSSLLIILSFSVRDALAHPGRTDSNGGHTCWTNCAKWGLKTGEYHFHNGGGSGGGSSSRTSTQAPRYSQADVDRGRKSGQNNGYEDGYNRSSRNPNTDNENEGYQKGYKAGYEAGYNEGLKKVKEEDILAGAKSGKSDGKRAYQNGEKKEVSPNDSKSDEWNKAYRAAFIKAFDREKVLDDTKHAGYDLGYSLAKKVVPNRISNDKELKKLFEKHYKIGFEKRIEEEHEAHQKLGFEDGYVIAVLSVDSLDKRFEDSYKKGYDEGKTKRKEEVYAEGHQSAYKNMDYQEPDSYDNEVLVEWYKKGYESNNIAKQIKNTAFENGHMNSKYFIPKEFKVDDDSIALYDKLFEEGKQLRKQETKTKMMYASGIGIPFVGIAVGGYLFRKRKKKNK
ncbi:YHYH domain-containing protein [Heyndrickxia sp. NPDC080065]|uniref:YHYH domain-containing protein n=1 Tax=Heyndrickxia sp. NPDC080065 TaxID=3390568 RepID=UPI003D03EF0E